MLHVATVMVGNYCGRGADYVERLHDMVRRNLADGFPGRFVCFTDDPDSLKQLVGVQTERLPRGLSGWWNKLALFAPDAFPRGDRVLYFDLDTVITGPLDEIAAFNGFFSLLRDAYRPDGLQSSVMAWEAGTLDQIWSDWMQEGQPQIAGGDQEWIERTGIQAQRWQDVFPGRFRSYKVDCVWNVPEKTSVVFFHGLPRPHEVLTGWVPDVWKVGGGSAAELVNVGTVAQDTVLANMRAAIAAGYPILEPGDSIAASALLCAGGPSLKDQLPLIHALQQGGVAVFAVNQVDGFLRDHGITPNFHVMLDARQEHAKWVNEGGIKLYASMCHPDTLKAGAAEGDLTIWHPVTDGIDTVVTKGLLIGGGTTVGCRSMALAYAMGFRKLLCVGFDSCYLEGAHHAYPQALNDADRVLDVICGGEKFKCAPWMVQQSQDWKSIAAELSRLGCEITVFGEGLIAAVARTLNDEFVEVEGLWWPARDHETRPAVLATLADLHFYIVQCAHKGVAVQAGGNIGIWPKELAKHFERVITFEPDPQNWACLVRNISEPNISCFNSALGDCVGSVGIQHDDTNCGASCVNGPGSIPVTTLDSLNLNRCDLLQLDIEGYELKALKGAENTIRRCSPLIVLELKHLGDRYGDSDEATIQYLATLGYQFSGRAHRDVIFKRYKNYVTRTA